MALVAFQVEPDKLCPVNVVTHLSTGDKQAVALLLPFSFCFVCSSKEKSCASAFRCTEVFLPNYSLSNCGTPQNKMWYKIKLQDVFIVKDALFYQQQ